jgi:hypothetical protein
MPIDEANPWHSSNARIHPDYVKEANEDLRKRGVVNAGFDNDGRAIAHSQKGRNEILKYLGYVDKSGGYNDYTGS